MLATPARRALAYTLLLIVMLIVWLRQQDASALLSHAG